MEELSPEHSLLVHRFVNECSTIELDSARFRAESVESVALRFLRARQFDFAKASALLSEAYLKKIEHNVADKIRRTANENAKCDIECAKNWYPHAMPGFDKQNRPILFEHTGGITPSVLSIMTTREDLVCYHWWVMENLLNEALEEASRRSSSLGLPFSISTFVILDFSGFNSSHCTKAMLDHVKGLVAIDNCCYPEILGKLIVVNAPWLSVGIWNLVKGWLDPRTQAKIEILNSSDSTTRLLDFVDAAVLPASYGGTGPVFHTPKPDTEYVTIPRNGHVRRMVTVPAHKQLFVDSYIAEGIVEFIAAEVSTLEPQHHHGMPSTHDIAKSNYHTHGINLVKHLLSGNGSPERFCFECPVADVERIVVLSWINSARFTSRQIVYSFSIKESCALWMPTGEPDPQMSDVSSTALESAAAESC